MYDIALSTGSTDRSWEVLAVRRALGDARAELESVAATLHALVAETAWTSKGVRALNERLAGIAGDVGGEITRLTREIDELDRGWPRS